MSDDTSLNSEMKALICMMARTVKPVKKRWALVCPAASLTVTLSTVGVKELLASRIFSRDLSCPSYCRNLAFCCATTQPSDYEGGYGDKSGALRKPNSFSLARFQNHSSVSPPPSLD